MLRPSRKSLWSLWAYRSGVCFCLVAYLTAAAGIPLAAPEEKDRSQPFPCMEHPCGCRNAEECWRHCCCFTPSEKLAWANAHGVTPPAYAERSDGESRTARMADSNGEDHSHACCESGHQHSECPDSASNGACRHIPTGSSGLPVLRSFARLSCHGFSHSWVSTGAVIRPPQPLNWTPYFADLGTLHCTQCTVHSLSAIPPDPPPRDLPV